MRAFYWNAFITGFCLRPPLLAVLLLVSGLLTRHLGEGFGAVDLVYHDDLWKQFWGGLSLGLLVVGTLLVGFLLWNADLARDGARAPVAWPWFFWTAERPAAARWPFAGYAVGIVTCFVITTAAFVGVYALLPQVLVWLGATRMPEPDLPEGRGRVATYWPTLLGLGASVGVAWAVLAVGLSDGVSAALGWAGRTVQAGARWVRGRAWAPADGGAAAGDMGYVGFRWALAGGAALMYFAVAYLAGPVGWLWGVAALVGLGLGAPLVLAAAWLFAPRCWRRLVADVARNTRMPDERLYRYHAAAALLVGVALGLTSGLSAFEGHNSPVTVVSFSALALVALYGVVAYATRRALPFLVGVLLLLLVSGGATPYKFRFEGLPGYREPGPGEGVVMMETKLSQEDLAYLHKDGFLARCGLREGSIVDGTLREAVLNLTLHARLDDGRQRRFDALLKGGGEVDGELDRVAREARFNRVRALIDPRRPVGAGGGEPAGPGDPALLGVEGLGLLSGEAEGGRPRGDQPLAVVTVSGGGLRAAAWALQVLQQLELTFARQGVDFPARVRLISGASGGMLGAAYYVATLPPRAERAAIWDAGKKEGYLARREAAMRGHREALAGDFLTPLMRRAVFNDLPSAFSPFPNLRDRGRALESAWGERLGEADGSYAGAGRPALGLTFADLRERERAGDSPSLVFSPMMVEDGRRLLISNLDLRYLAANRGWRLGPEAEAVRPEDDVLYSLEALELFRLFPEAKGGGAAGGLTLATAARMSASFPVFSPPATLPTYPRRRLVDAGYYDNYGVSLASAFLFSASNREWITAGANKLVVIQVRASRTEEERGLRDVPPGAPGVLGRSAEEVTTPPAGAYSSLFSSASFRNDGQLELLSAYMRARRRQQVADRQEAERRVEGAREFLRQTRPPVDVPAWPGGWPGKGPAVKEGHATRYFTTATFELGEEAALSWYLSRGDRDKIEREGEAVAPGGRPGATLAHLLTWWRVGVGGEE